MDKQNKKINGWTQARMDSDRLVTILRIIYQRGRRFPGSPNNKIRDLIDS